MPHITLLEDGMHAVCQMHYLPLEGSNDLSHDTPTGRLQGSNHPVVEIGQPGGAGTGMKDAAMRRRIPGKR